MSSKLAFAIVLGWFLISGCGGDKGGGGADGAGGTAGNGSGGSGGTGGTSGSGGSGGGNPADCPATEPAEGAMCGNFNLACGYTPRYCCGQFVGNQTQCSCGSGADGGLSWHCQF